MKTSPRSGELARKTGVSPSDVLATVGTLPTVDRDTAAANIAGRTDVNVATLGDLARRARVGNELSPIPTPGSVGLGTIGKKICNEFAYWSCKRSAYDWKKMARLNIAQVLLVTLEAA